MREALEKDALHLHMKAAGVRRRPADIAGVDHRHLGTFLREIAAGRDADDPTADDEDVYLTQDGMRSGVRGRERAHGLCHRAISAIATGLTGMRGAKRRSSSRLRLSFPASSCDKIMPQ